MTKPSIILAPLALFVPEVMVRLLNLYNLSIHKHEIGNPFVKPTHLYSLNTLMELVVHDRKARGLSKS